MIYVNDCSIRVVQSCIKIFVQEIFVQILHTKIILQLNMFSISFLQCYNTLGILQAVCRNLILMEQIDSVA